MISRQHIFTAVVFVLVAGVLAGFYQFHFREQLQQYTRDEETVELMQSRLEELQDRFHGTEPERLVEKWRVAVGPWQQTLQERVAFFDYDAEPVEDVPEGVIAKFYYREKATEMLQNLQKDAFAKRIPIPGYMTFGAPDPEQIQGGPSPKLVKKWLERINLGCYITRQLMEAEPRAIYSVVVWPARKEHDILEMQTFGFALQMRMGKLLGFLEDLRTANRYYTVDAFKIANSSLRMPDPPLQVMMLMTQARFLSEEVGWETGGGAETIATGEDASESFFMTDRTLASLEDPYGDSGRTMTASAPVRKKSWWEKLWPF